jgi:YgiT-type zinc finger domain-containing protein
MSYDYGHCHLCSGTVDEKTVDHTMHAGDEWILVRSVPTGVCTKCGEQILRWQVTEKLEQIISQRGNQMPETRIEMPVFAYR